MVVVSKGGQTDRRENLFLALAEQTTLDATLGAARVVVTSGAMEFGPENGLTDWVEPADAGRLQFARGLQTAGQRATAGDQRVLQGQAQIGCR